MKYAPSTGCFYPDDIAYTDGTIPGDAVDTTRDVFDAWCAAAPGSTIVISGTDLTIQPPAPPTLDQIKAAKIGNLTSLYQKAAAEPVSFMTAAGDQARFPRDAGHRAMVDTAVAGGAPAWTANVWVDDGNTPVMPFTFVDLQALQVALAAPTKPSLTDLMLNVAAVHSAADAEAVAAVTF